CRFASLPHFDLVNHYHNTKYGVGDSFGDPLGFPVIDMATQRDLTVLDIDLDITSIDNRMLAEPLIDVFFNTIVRTFVTTWTPACILPFPTTHRFVPSLVPSTTTQTSI